MATGSTVPVQVMMGHREKLKGGNEYDALTKARRDFGPTASVVKQVKRAFWKRLRGKMRQILKASWD